jgi:hypothetical protein
MLQPQFAVPGGGGPDDTTIFNIIMDLKQRQGIIRMG